nr:unnamed protein product [Spirometra erinaceieuropaei]
MNGKLLKLRIRPAASRKFSLQSHRPAEYSIRLKIWVSSDWGPEPNRLAHPVANPLSSGSKYAIVVDAGSSGSRIFVYCVDTENSPPGEIPIITLCKDAEDKPIVKKKTPGISSFAGRTSEVEPYISDLIQLASDYIPAVAHSSTPLYILATAGMRLLTEVQQEAIWAAVRRTIKTKFAFNFEDSCAQTVSGLYEALFGWTTVNYLLGKLSANHYPSDTVGMLDMGGASMQIAYEVPAETTVPDDLIMNFTVGKARFRPTSGHPRPPREPEAEVRLVYTDDNEPKFIISDPCLQPGRETILTTEDLVISRRLSATRQASGIPAVVFQGTGNLTLCRAFQKVLLKKDSPCPTAPCSMNGVHQPPIDFTKSKFYAMSEYWYTSADLDNRVNTYGFSEFQNLAKTACSTPWEQLLNGYLQQNLDAASIRNRQSLCFKAAWIMNVLHTGFGFPEDYTDLQPVERLEGIEVQWSLGALIYYMTHSTTLLGQKANPSPSEFTFTQVFSTILLILFCITALACLFILSRRCRPPLPCCLSPSKTLVVRLCPNRRGAGGVSSDSLRYSYSKISSPPPASTVSDPVNFDVEMQRVGDAVGDASALTGQFVNAKFGVNYRNSASLPALFSNSAASSPQRLRPLAI